MPVRACRCPAMVPPNSPPPAAGLAHGETAQQRRGQHLLRARGRLPGCWQAPELPRPVARRSLPRIRAGRQAAAPPRVRCHQGGGLELLRQLRADAALGISKAPPAHYTARKAAEDWLDNGLPGRSAKTVRKNKDVLEPILAVITTVKLRELDAAAVDRALQGDGPRLQFGCGAHGPPCPQASTPVRRRPRPGRPQRRRAVRNPAGQPGRPSRSITLEQSAAPSKQAPVPASAPTSHSASAPGSAPRKRAPWAGTSTSVTRTPLPRGRQMSRCGGRCAAAGTPRPSAPAGPCTAPSCAARAAAACGLGVQAPMRDLPLSWHPRASKQPEPAGHPDSPTMRACPTRPNTSAPTMPTTPSR